MGLFGRIKKIWKTPKPKESEESNYVAPQDPQEVEGTPSTDEASKSVATEPAEEGRKSHLFFGKYCDMRVAVVFLNVFNIALLLLSGFISLFRFGFGTIGMLLPGLVLSGIAIYGAMNFELWAMAIATVGFFLGLLSDLWFLNFVGVIFGAIVVYTHGMLTKEIHEGIMTKETYHKEEYIAEEIQEYIKV